MKLTVTVNQEDLEAYNNFMANTGKSLLEWIVSHRTLNVIEIEAKDAQGSFDITLEETE